MILSLVVRAPGPEKGIKRKRVTACYRQGAPYIRLARAQPPSQLRSEGRRKGGQVYIAGRWRGDEVGTKPTTKNALNTEAKKTKRFALPLLSLLRREPAVVYGRQPREIIADPSHILVLIVQNSLRSWGLPVRKVWLDLCTKPKKKHFSIVLKFVYLLHWKTHPVPHSQRIGACRPKYMILRRFRAPAVAT